MSSSPASPHVDRVSVAGLSIAIETETATDLALVHRMIGTAPSSGPVDATIRLGAESPALPSRPPDFEGPYGDHWDDEEVHAFRHHWGLHARVTDDLAVLGGPASGHDRWVTVRNSMLFVTARLFLARGLFVLHGAGVRRGDEGLVAIGDSGTGKSTLAYAASLAGWGVLGDDMVVVDPTQSDLRLRGIPRVPSIPGELAAVTGAVGDRVPRDTRERQELVGHEMDPGEARLTGVVICAHGVGAGAVTDVDPVTAVQALIPAFVLADLPGPLRQWFPLALRLANGCCVQLAHAAIAGDRLERSAEMTEEAARRAAESARGHRP